MPRTAKACNHKRHTLVGVDSTAHFYRCDDCGELWCSQCLVPTTRKRQPTRCIECALVAAGVRAPGARRTAITSMTRTRRSPTNLF